MFKRIISLILALVLVAGLLPAPGYAAEAETAPETEATAAPVTEEPAPETEPENPETESTAANTEEPTAPETEPGQDTGTAADLIASGTTGDLSWALGDDGTLSITGSGKMAGYSSGTAPWYSLRAKILSLEIGEGVTYVGKYAFSDCVRLTSVTVPASLTQISSYAFYNCTALTRVDISDLVSWCSLIFGAGTSGHVWATPLNNGASLYLNGSLMTNLEFPAGLTKIKPFTFYGCTSLEEVTVPQGVTAIGEFAFSECENLTRISLPDTLVTVDTYSFNNCAALTRVDIPSVEAWVGISFDDPQANPLYNQAALYVAGEQLTRLAIPDSVMDIPQYQFMGCTGLEEVTMGSDVLTIGNFAFTQCPNLKSVILPDSVLTIGQYSFAHCISLEGIALPKDLYAIEAGAFANSGLAAITIPSGVYELGSNAFANTNLVTITIPSGVNELGSYAFENCKSLKEITFLGSAPAMDQYSYPFSGVTATIRYPAGDSTWDSVAGSNLGGNLTWLRSDGLYEEGTLDSGLTWQVWEDGSLRIAGQGAITYSDSAPWYKYRSVITRVELGEGVTAIGKNALRGLTGMTEVSLPTSIATIGEYAFYGCTALETIALPQGLTTIGDYAFNSCTALETINLPQGLTTIGDYAFSDCTVLETITFTGKAPAIGYYAFRNVTATVYYPAGDDSWQSIAGQNYSGNLTWLRSDGLYAQGTLDSGLTWQVWEDGSLRITGQGAIGDMTYYYSAPWYKYRNLITRGELEEGVTGIGKNAFRELTKVTSLSLPTSLAAIGEYAFYGCTALESLTLPQGLTGIGTWAFYNCTGLKTVSFPATLTNIGEYGFGGCTALQTVSFPATLTELGNYAFAGCTALETITFTGKAPTIGYGAFDGVTATVYYPAGDDSWQNVAGNNYSGTLTWVNTDGLLGSGQLSTGLAWEATQDGTLTISGIGQMPDFNSSDMPWYSIRSKITRVLLEEGVTKIGQCSFCDMKNLAQITIPASVMQVGSGAFNGCAAITRVNLGDITLWCGYGGLDSSCRYELYLAGEKLEHLVVPQGVETIAFGAFRGCISLKSVTIPDSVQQVDSYAFADCTNLEAITVRPWAGDASTRIYDSAFRDCTALNTVTLPEVAYLGYEAFAGCTALETITLPSPLGQYGGNTSHGNGVFAGCTALKTVTVLSGSHAIPKEMFRDCTALETVLLPNTITAIGASAFAGCTSLKAITLPQSLSTISATAFQNTALEAITIPGGVSALEAGAFAQCGSLTAITFLGNAPTVATTALQGITATVTYNPALTGWGSIKGNATWGGAAKLTWVTESGAKIIASGTCGDNLSWMLDEEGIFTVTGSGYMTDYTNNTPWRDDYADKIVEVRFRGNVQSIGSYAFYGCENLATVTLPETLEWVGGYAFAKCESLASLTLAPADYGERTFEGCTALEEVTIPAIYNGSRMFYGCTGLKTVSFLPGTRNIGHGMFHGCTRLAQVELPDTLKTISSEAFYGCSSLKEIVLPNGVTEIYHMAFFGCADLASAVIPDGVTILGGCLFQDCTSLTSITIPASVTEIQDSAFYGCAALKTIKFNGRAPSFDLYTTELGEEWSSVFYNVTAKAYYPEKYASSWQNARKNYGGNITWVAYSAQDSGETETGMTWEVSADGNLTLRGTGEIPDYAARSSLAPWAGYADQITAIVLEGSFTRIGVSAFAGLHRAEEITIPTTVETIGYGAFAGCDALAIIHYGGSDWQWAEIVIEEGNEVLEEAQRVEPIHRHRPVLTILPGWPATEEQTGREDILIHVCEGCGVYVHEDATEISEEELQAIFREHTLYMKARSITIQQELEFVDLNQGSTVSLTALLLPASAKPAITWSTSAGTIAGVSQQGLVTFLKPGTVTITVKGPDGVKDTIRLTGAYLPQELTLTAPDTQLRSGKSMTLTALLAPENTTNKALLWSVSDPDAASISAKGVLKAKTVYEETPITVTVWAKDAPSVRASIPMTILPKTDEALAIHANGEAATAKTILCDVADTFLLTAHTYGSMEEVTWKSSKAAALVDENGNLSFGKTGTYTITARASDGRTAKVTFKVTVLVRELTLSSKTGFLSVASGKKLTLTAQALPETAKSKKVTWEIIEGGEYAKISSSGVLTAAKGLTEAQKVLVCATAKDGSNIWNTLEVTVYPAAEAVTLDQGSKGTLDMSIQDYFDLTAHAEPAAAFQAFTWSSSSTKVATVDEDGRVTPLKPGTVTITAKAADGSGKSAKFKLTITASITSLELPADTFVIGGKTLTLKPEIGPGYATNKTLVWTCDAPANVASINSRGQLKTKKVTAPVTVTVTAAATDGSSWEAQCDVTIYPAVQKVELTRDGQRIDERKLIVTLGQDIDLGAIITPAESLQEVTWTSSRASTAEVDEYGTVTTLKAGTVTITAKAMDGSGKKASIKIQIIAPNA